MAWTAGVVAVLLVTLSSTVQGDDPGTKPWTEIMFVKPSAGPMSITVLAEDEGEYRGFNVTLQKKKCFPSDSPWHFTQVNVAKAEHGELQLSLTVGACEVNCTLDDPSANSSETSTSLGNIIVIPFGLEYHIKNSTEMEKPDDYPHLTDCTKYLREKLFCPCATNKTVQGSSPTLDTILLVVLVVQMLGMAVMAVIVFVVVRKASRTIIRLDTDEKQQEDNMSDAASTATEPHEQD